MRLASIAAFAIATLVGTSAASPYSPFLEKRSTSCKNDNGKTYVPFTIGLHMIYGKRFTDMIPPIVRLSRYDVILN
jgi:hypothetical protein